MAKRDISIVSIVVVIVVIVIAIIGISRAVTALAAPVSQLVTVQERTVGSDAVAYRVERANTVEGGMDQVMVGDGRVQVFETVDVLGVDVAGNVLVRFV